MSEALVALVDDDPDALASLQALLEAEGFAVRAFLSARSFLGDPMVAQCGCLISDIRMPDMDGLGLQKALAAQGVALPIIFVTGHAEVEMAVQAMRDGAVDFMEKPYGSEMLLESLRRALAQGADVYGKAAMVQAARERVACLTERERQVLAELVAGRSNKIIAYELDISTRTVEVHRARVMAKLGARSLSDLVRLALAADFGPGSPHLGQIRIARPGMGL
jgi:two-component system, LuxR family, response regulator FixJ